MMYDRLTVTRALRNTQGGQTDEPLAVQRVVPLHTRFPSIVSGLCGQYTLHSLREGTTGNSPATDMITMMVAGT